MITIETLRDWHRRSENFGQVDLITLGSPYKAVFNHYFPHMFAKVHAGLVPNLTTWTNIYRANDYVGKELTEHEAGVTEIPHPPLGHNDYLRHEDVLVEIARRILADKT